MNVATLPLAPKALLRGCADSLRLTLLFGLAACVALGQTGGGATLVGTVTDGSGAVIAGAKVSVVNTGTSILTESTTTAEGGYYVPYLAAGSYRVTVNAPGF